jgi:membrane-associated phospholipid phosphatase
LLLKSMTRRKRPLASISNGTPDGTFTNNPYDFGNSRRPTFSSSPLNRSFPSFHFTAWFAVAKVYQEAYDNYWLSYSVLAVGLASNIRGHHHWVSDMTAGALIGTGIGWSVSKDQFGDEKSLTVRASFIDGPRLLISKQF